MLFRVMRVLIFPSSWEWESASLSARQAPLWVSSLQGFFSLESRTRRTLLEFPQEQKQIHKQNELRKVPNEISP